MPAGLRTNAGWRTGGVGGGRGGGCRLLLCRHQPHILTLFSRFHLDDQLVLWILDWCSYHFRLQAECKSFLPPPPPPQLLFLRLAATPPSSSHDSKCCWSLAPFTLPDWRNVMHSYTRLHSQVHRRSSTQGNTGIMTLLEDNLQQQMPYPQLSLKVE
ncbi:unnamed protein product [Pleuronectes platessa]|uniref:Uncharacterized protein n=1 Tax=Pleuronectes platessa TaxID=8262 RepID=A0A9N7VXP3_PLEPL|nr:unnamed protein product [Pleuronectes platessa]